MTLRTTIKPLLTDFSKANGRGNIDAANRAMAKMIEALVDHIETLEIIDGIEKDIFGEVPTTQGTVNDTIERSASNDAMVELAQAMVEDQPLDIITALEDKLDVVVLEENVVETETIEEVAEKEIKNDETVETIEPTILPTEEEPIEKKKPGRKPKE